MQFIFLIIMVSFASSHCAPEGTPAHNRSQGGATSSLEDSQASKDSKSQSREAKQGSSQVTGDLPKSDSPSIAFEEQDKGGEEPLSTVSAPASVGGSFLYCEHLPQGQDVQCGILNDQGSKIPTESVPQVTSLDQSIAFEVEPLPESSDFHWLVKDAQAEESDLLFSFSHSQEEHTDGKTFQYLKEQIQGPGSLHSLVSISGATIEVSVTGETSEIESEASSLEGDGFTQTSSRTRVSSKSTDGTPSSTSTTSNISASSP